MSSIPLRGEQRIISPFQKPRLIVPREIQKPQRLPKRERMTIAIGMLCEGGMIVAADTQMTYTDGTTYDSAKIKTLRAATGAYVIAYSCLEINPAQALASDILSDLNLSDPKSLIGVEDIVKSRLRQWAEMPTAGNDRPQIAFILGCRLDTTPNNSDCLGLYLCESSGILLRKTVEDSNGYIAIGAGSVVTDPLFRMLFDSPVHPRLCLSQLSYLMYRAKKDCRGACGGGTDAVLLRSDNPEPARIDGILLAEQRYGAMLDRMLSRITAQILSRNGFDDKSRFTKFFDEHFSRKMIRQDFGMYGFTFRTGTGEAIREPELQKMMDDPEKYLEP